MRERGSIPVNPSARHVPEDKFFATGAGRFEWMGREAAGNIFNERDVAALPGEPAD